MAKKIVAACGGDVAGKTLAVLGLTFKPNTDDMRESPSLSILPRLRQAGAEIRAFDPEGVAEARRRGGPYLACAATRPCRPGRTRAKSKSACLISAMVIWPLVLSSIRIT
jgi:UDP-glucose 6-dehydrogenase